MFSMLQGILIVCWKGIEWAGFLSYPFQILEANSLGKGGEGSLF